MSTVNTGWLKDNNGEKFAPKTLSSQVINKDGISIDTLLNNIIIDDARDVGYDNTSSGLSATNVQDAMDEIQQEIDDEKEDREQAIVDLKAQGIQQTPLFANSIEECTDTSKVYVLPDGYIYGYKMTERVTGGYTNLAEPLPDNTTDTTKWVVDHRISSSGVSAQTGKTVSNQTIVNTTDVIRVKGTEFVANVDRIALWHQNGSAIEIQYVSALPSSNIGYAYVDGVYEFTIKGANITDANVRFAFTTPTDASSIIITKNEEIVEGAVVKEYAWINTNHAFVPNDYDEEFVALNEEIAETKADIVKLQTANQETNVSIEELKTKVENIGTLEIPDYWKPHLDEQISKVNDIQNQFGKDCFSFVHITDFHLPSNLGKKSPVLAKEVMKRTNSRRLLNSGDVQTRSCHSTKEALLAENKAIIEAFEPVIDDMLLARGNHDGAYGTVNGVTYAKQLNENEMFSEYYRKNGLSKDAHFSDDGNAYYVDDVSNKVRYIALNTHCVPNSASDVNSDGTAKNTKFRALNFTQAQFDFLSEEALVDGLTEKWKVVVFGHVYIHEGQNDFALMADLLSAYKNKTSYSGSYNGNSTWDSVSVDVDFSNAKGKFVAYFCGHNHIDAVYEINGIKCITTRCDAKEENDATLNAERVKGTITEQSFGVYTVTPDTIYETKIGAGSDRVISY